MPPKLQIKPKAPPRGRRGGAGSGAESTPADGSTPAGDATASTPAAAPPPPTVATTRSIAPPAGRLDSLKTPNVVSGSPAGGILSAGATPPPGALRGKAPLRFKPKAVVRKTAEERAKLEAAVAAASVTSGPSGEGEASRGGSGGGGFSGRGPRGGAGGEFRGRGRGGRGRGRGRGGADAGYQAVASTASGPFALGSVTSGRNKVIHERGNDIRTSTTKSKSKSKGIHSLDADGVKIKSERGDDPDYYSSTDEESDGGPKVNVERMVDLIDSDEEDDEVVEKGEKMPVMFPLRVERIKHEERERAIPIFKDPDTNKKGKGGRKVKLEEGEVQVKAEPIDDGDIAIVDAPPITDLDTQPILPPSPELTKKNLIKPSQSPELKRKDRRKSSGAGRRRRPSQILSPEEEMEVKMEEEDRLATLRELGMSLPNSEGRDEAEDNAAVELEGIKNGDLFFFQFPTILPPLEPIQQVPAPGDASALVDLDSTATPGIKTEPGTQKKRADKAADKAARLKAAYHERTPLPQGMVGQLRIHKSGKVSILWGNPDSSPHQDQHQASSSTTPTTNTPTSQPIEMLVARGAQCEFLQDVVVMNPLPKEDEEGKDPKEDMKVNEKALEVVNAGLVDSKTGKKKGGVWSLGQVRGRFVVSPDFEKLVGGGGR